MKTKVIAIIIVAFLVLTTLLVVFLRKNETKGLQAINAIPVNSGIVLKVNGLIPFLNSIADNEYFQGIPDASITSNFQLLKEKLDSLCDNNSFVYDVLHDSAIYISIHANNNAAAGVNFYLPFKSTGYKNIFGAEEFF